VIVGVCARNVGSPCRYILTLRTGGELVVRAERPSSLAGGRATGAASS